MARYAQASQPSSSQYNPRTNSQNSGSYSTASRIIYEEIYEEISFEEALDRVASGGMDGSTLYRQAPNEICTVLNQASMQLFQLPFSSLSNDRQKELCRQLLSPPTVSLEQLQLVSSGKVPGKLLYDQAPKQFCEILDKLSEAVFHAGFKKLSIESQKEICSILLNAAAKSSPSNR